MKQNPRTLFSVISVYLWLRSKRLRYLRFLRRVFFFDGNEYYIAACSPRCGCLIMGTKDDVVCVLLSSGTSANQHSHNTKRGGTEDLVTIIYMTINNQQAAEDKCGIRNKIYETVENKKQDTGELLKAGKPPREAPKNELIRNIKLHGSFQNQQDTGRLFKEGKKNGEAPKNNDIGDMKREVLESYVWINQPLPQEQDRSIIAYPVTAVPLTNPDQSGDNPSASSIWPMRSERRRYASYDSRPRIDGWPSRLARHGFYFSLETDHTKCFLCGNPPPDHNATCRWQYFNIPFASVGLSPEPDPRHVVQALGVTLVDDPPTPENLDQRIATLLRYYPEQIARPLAKAGFFADDRGLVTCFSCGLVLARGLLSMMIGGQLRLLLIKLHSGNNPGCAFIQQMLASALPPP